MPVSPSAIRQIREAPCSIAQTLERDEQLLEEARATVRVARVSERTLSQGVGQAHEGPAVVRARSRSIPTVRRKSGGTGLLHFPGDVTWAVVLPRSWIGGLPNLQDLYESLGVALNRSLRRWDIPSGWDASPRVAEDYCLLSGRGRVLTAVGRALGGAAQHLTRSALLHHGTISGHQDFDEIAQIFDFPVASAGDHLTDLYRLGMDESQQVDFEVMVTEQLGQVLRQLSPNPE